MKIFAFRHRARILIILSRCGATEGLPFGRRSDYALRYCRRPAACAAGAGSEVRIGGVVQVNSILPPGSTVPIGWVAVGDPAQVYPPDQHERIWAVQESLDSPGTARVLSVAGVDQ